MYVLIMIVLVGANANLSHIYFEDAASCQAAAHEFESHRSKEMKLKAFCMRGE